MIKKIMIDEKTNYRITIDLNEWQINQLKLEADNMAINEYIIMRLFTPCETLPSKRKCNIATNRILCMYLLHLQSTDIKNKIVEIEKAVLWDSPDENIDIKENIKEIRDYIKAIHNIITYAIIKKK